MLVKLLAGFFTGILSGWGIGGGTLLLVYLTAFADMEPMAAGGINLLCFLPCAALALRGHRRAGLLDRKIWRPAVLGGLLGAAGGMVLARWVGRAWLRKLLGWLLLLTGLRELLSRK